MRKLLFIPLLFICSLSLADEVRIQHRIKQVVEINGANMEFNDCLYFSEEEYSKLDPKDLDIQRQARIDVWVNVILNPTPRVEPTEEELAAYKTDLEKQLADLTSQIAEKG